METRPPCVALSSLWKKQAHAGPSCLQNLRNDHRHRTAHILRTEIPAKLKHLQNLIESESDPSSLLCRDQYRTLAFVPPTISHQPCLLSPPCESVPEAEQSSCGWMMSGDHWLEVVLTNTIQTELVKMVIQEAQDVHLLIQDLRIWLELEIPGADDGDNFGAEVQEVLIDELEYALDDTVQSITSLTEHHIDRVEVIKEWIKYPNIMDYPAAIASSDRFDHFIARSFLRDLIRILGGILARCERNWVKIIDPMGGGLSVT